MCREPTAASRARVGIEGPVCVEDFFIATVFIIACTRTAYENTITRTSQNHDYDTVKIAFQSHS